ncbi:MAG: HDOD domain-containing protein [Clostridiaceae bacterium]|nr:HDOD domain-containing protein [Clostridiaceae bacterium]
MQNHPVLKMIKESEYLPKIPRVFGEALNMLLDPCEFNMDECIERLSRVPKLESTLIQILKFNSTLSRKIITLRDAVVYLGAKNTRMIAVAYITKLLLPNRNGRAKIFNNSTYWKHCIAASIASYMIAEETGLCDKDRIFTYGLIHDIGITVMDICIPDYLDKIYTLQQEKGLHQIVAEKIVLNGITHTEIGMWICDEWGLPDEIKDIIGYHHHPFKKSEAGDAVKVMHLADSISAQYYAKLLGDKKSFIYNDKIIELLNLSKEFVEKVAESLPGEVEKIYYTIDI